MHILQGLPMKSFLQTIKQIKHTSYALAISDIHKNQNIECKLQKEIRDHPRKKIQANSTIIIFKSS